VPLTSGFVARFGVIQAAIRVGSYELAIIAMVCAVIAAFVYLRIMVSMWLSDATSSVSVRVPLFSTIAIAIAVSVTLAVGVLPSLLLDLTSNLTQLASK
jgi:NADH-quinone oxidoreductase subunit N